MGRGGALTNESPAVAFFGISIACILISQVAACTCNRLHAMSDYSSIDSHSEFQAASAPAFLTALSAGSRLLHVAPRALARHRQYLRLLIHRCITSSNSLRAV